MPGQKEVRRSDDRDGRRPRSAPPPTERDRLPPALLADHRLDGTGAGGTRAALVGQLQRTAGNHGVQQLLAGQAVSRQPEPGSAATAGATDPVVDDATRELAPGQMRRTPFLAALRTEVEGALASAGPLAQADAQASFPAAYADLQAQDTAGLLRSLRDNLPGVEGADAGRWIAAAGVAARARIVGEAPAAATGVVGRVLSAVGGLVSALFKVRDGGATPSDARVVRSRLGEGRPLDSSVRGPVEAAYGQDFSGVRIHTDAGAGELSTRLGARAFTVGQDIAFSPGEYDPGNPVGNALVAHELAHVGQQAAGGGAPTAALEEDADRAAVGAVVSQWTDTTGGQIEGVMPRLRAGLRLQRCAGGAGAGPAQVRPGSCATLTLDQWKAAVGAAKQKGAAAMTQLAQQALCELGIPVQAAGTKHSDAAHPDDYAETPVLNFDAQLNSKARWRTSPKEDPKPIGDNVGYNFLDGKRRFAIIGPNALSEDSPLRTRQYAQHELNLVAQDQAKGETKADMELAAWTEDFRGYFHQYLVLKHNRPTWQPLIGYYRDANDGPKKQALQRLVAYYNSPPVAADQADSVRKAMRMWMSKTSGALIDALNGALPAAP